MKGLVSAWDSVAHANVLYVSECKNKLIHRIQLADETSSHWSVDSEYLAMSINKKGNIVVSCWNLYKLIEYTPTGSFVREIKVNDGTSGCLIHAIQLDDDRFLVCLATATDHHVSIIDNIGRVMKNYGGAAGSGIGQMHVPCYLAIDRNGFILVVDENNDRVIILNSSLEFIREFIPGCYGLKKPMRMHLHEATRRLYISDFAQKYIAIFDWYSPSEE